MSCGSARNTGPVSQTRSNTPTIACSSTPARLVGGHGPTRHRDPVSGASYASHALGAIADDDLSPLRSRRIRNVTRLSRR